MISGDLRRDRANLLVTHDHQECGGPPVGLHASEIQARA
jgi:hypothetical protein